MSDFPNSLERDDDDEGAGFGVWDRGQSKDAEKVHLEWNDGKRNNFGFIEYEEEEGRELDGPIVRTEILPPGSGNYDWESIQSGLIQHRISKGRKPDGSKIPKEEMEPEEQPVTVVQRGSEVEIEKLPTSPRTIAARAQNAGWKVRASYSKTDRAAVKYRSDSSSKNVKEYSLGDVRFEAESQEHWWVEGVLFSESGDRVAAFRLNFLTRLKPEQKPKNEPSFRQHWDSSSGLKVARTATNFNDWFYSFVEKPETKKKKSILD